MPFTMPTDEVLRDMALTMSHVEIADALGCSRSLVTKTLAARGIKTVRRRRPGVRKQVRKQVSQPAPVRQQWFPVR